MEEGLEGWDGKGEGLEEGLKGKMEGLEGMGEGKERGGKGRGSYDLMSAMNGWDGMWMGWVCIVIGVGMCVLGVLEGSVFRSVEYGGPGRGFNERWLYLDEKAFGMGILYG